MIESPFLLFGTLSGHSPKNPPSIPRICWVSLLAVIWSWDTFFVPKNKPERCGNTDPALTKPCLFGDKAMAEIDFSTAIAACPPKLLGGWNGVD